MEFHAIILCGGGKALVPFSQVRNTGTPKALLPIANKPMLEYVLEYCDKAVFPAVTVVCSNGEHEEISKAIEAFKAKQNQKQSSQDQLDESNSSSNQLGITVAPMDEENSGPILNELIKSQTLVRDNVVLLPCDFITDMPPQVLIEAYRARSTHDLGLVVTYKNQFTTIEDKKRKIFKKVYVSYSETDDGQYRLLDYVENDDIIYNKSLNIRTQMAWRYPNVNISSKLLSSGIFFGDIPKLKKIFEDEYVELYLSHRSTNKVVRDLARRLWKKSKLLDTVGLFIVPQQATFFRANNLPVYMESQRYFMQIQAQERQGAPPKDKNIGHDSLVGEKTELGEKSTIKRTVVGKNCIIGKRVKLTGSVIHDGVTIEDDVQLENCIVGKDAIIRGKTRLTNCNVELTLEVVRGTTAKGETLLVLLLEGIVPEDEEDDDEEDEDSDDYAVGSDESDEEESDGEFEYGDNSDGLFAY